MNTVLSAAVANNALFIEAPRVAPKDDSMLPSLRCAISATSKSKSNRPPMDSLADHSDPPPSGLALAVGDFTQSLPQRSRENKRREPLAWRPAARLSSSRVDWPAQPSLDLAQNYFSRISWIVSIVLL
jgi:hypothetical protein